MPNSATPLVQAPLIEDLEALQWFASFPELEFDSLALLASEMCDVPVALISLIHKDHIWFKSRVGFDDAQALQMQSFCCHVLEDVNPIIVDDASVDPRFQNTKCVLAAQGIRFYAGIPLVLASGVAVGCLCVIDYAPRTLTAKQLLNLTRIAGQVVALIEARQNHFQMMEQERNRLVSEQRLAFALEAAEIGDWDMDLRTNVARRSALHDQCFGYTEPVPIWGYDTFLAHIVEEDRDRVDKCFQQAMAGEGAYDVEFRVLWADQTLHWLWSKGRFYFDDFGKPYRVAGIQVDITKRRKIEEDFRESEAKFRTIANAMPQMVWSARPDGFNDYFNQQWYDYTGVPEGSSHGNEWSKVFHPEDQPLAWERWNNSLRTGETYEIQYRMRHHSGRYRWVLGRAFPVVDDTGKIIRWMGTCTDIHDQKLAEEELRESGHRKDEFLAMMAHELRNPIAPISAAAELLTLTGCDEQRVSQASEIIIRQVDHMTTLINDLLDISRVTRGLVKIEPEILDLKAIINSAIEQASPLIETRKHKLQLCISSSAAYINGDRTRLVQVIVNLLTNAAKYTPPGGEIEVVLNIHPSAAEISIRDNGIGIDPDFIPHIFNLFTQGKRTPDRAQGGLGLGLSLVKSLIDLHGGQVNVHSDGLGKGSVFTLILPLSEKAEITQSKIPLDRMSLQKIQPLTLMIVDDNLDAARSLAALLEVAGHKVTVFEDGYKALDAIGHDVPQVFILDIGLPGMDGYALVRRLRANPLTSNALMVALTGYGQERDRSLSKEAGFNHHFVKPIDTLKLASVLAQIN